jgi:hypothetical protein
VTNPAQAAQVSDVNPVSPQITPAPVTNPAQAAEASATNPVSPQIVAPVVTNPAEAAQAAAMNPVSPQIPAPVITPEQGRIKTMEENVYNQPFYKGQSGNILPGGTEGRGDRPLVEKQSDALAPISGEAEPSGTGSGTSTTTPSEQTTPTTTPVSTGEGLGKTTISEDKQRSSEGDQAVPERPINEPYEKLKELKFVYDPATDAGYHQAMASAENAIIQAMIGRGGMYSSVAQSAVAAKLMDLTIDYEKMAYDKYIAERDYLMDLASFEEDRINTAWDQNFSEKQFGADERQRAFENEMAIKQHEFEVEQEAFDQKMQLAEESASNSRTYSSAKQAQADKTVAETGISIESQIEKNADKLTKFEQMRSEWEKSGKASAEVAAFFADYGIQYGDNIVTNMNIIIKRHKQLEAERAQLMERRRALADDDLDRKFLSSY